jgi:lysophospholipase L1-like esterase
VNSAVVGDTSQQLLDRINSGEFDADLADSDAVIISIGGNDILGLFFGTNALTIPISVSFKPNFS